MATATDTGNQFADAWNANQWDGAKKATDIQAVAPDGKNPTVDAYRSAWAAENMGNYGDINVAPASSLLPQSAAAPATNPFRQQGGVLSGATMSGPGGMSGLLGQGGYGSWTYGMDIPQAGTPEFADYSAYFSNGGMDPNNLYGKAAETAQYAQAWNPSLPGQQSPTSGWVGLGGGSNENLGT